MSVALATTPQYPAAGKPARVDFSVSGGGNYLKGYFTDAPLASAIKANLISSGAARSPAFLTDSDKPWIFTPEVGGVYTLQIEQYTRGNSQYGGGYQDSPDGYLTETLISSANVTISVGQQVTQKIGSGSDVATLTLFIVGSTVRATLFEDYGFTSPLIDDAKTTKAITASLNPGVVTAALALAGQTTTAILGTLASVFDGLAAVFNAHLTVDVVGAIHFHADPDNVLSNADLHPTTPEGLKRSVGRLLQLLDRHMRNDDGGTATSLGGTGSAISGTGYHQNNFTDWENALLGLSAGDILDTFVGLADAQRAYVGHINNTVVHPSADSGNTPSALPPLLALHALFLAELAKQSPTAPPSVNPGVTALIHGAGFEES